MNIKLWTKQVFCKHIWKTVRQEHLGDTIEYIGTTAMWKHSYYAIFQECVKCSKTKTTEARYSVNV